MPLQETIAWQAIIKFYAPIIGVLGTAFWWLIRKWIEYRLRFQDLESRVERTEERMDSSDERIDHMEDVSSEHGVKIEAISTDIRHILDNGKRTHKSVARLHERFDEAMKRK